MDDVFIGVMGIQVEDVVGGPQHDAVLMRENRPDRVHDG